MTPPGGRVAADVAVCRPEGETRKPLVWIDPGLRWVIDEETAGDGGDLKPRDGEDLLA